MSKRKKHIWEPAVKVNKNIKYLYASIAPPSIKKIKNKKKHSIKKKKLFLRTCTVRIV